MKFPLGCIVEYQECRLYVLNTVKNLFKEYVVCINLTHTLKTNSDKIFTAILYHISDDKFEHVDNSSLFDTLIDKSARKLQKSAKDAIKIFGDTLDLQYSITEKEKSIIREYLKRVIDN